MSNELETLEKLAYENACCRCQYYDKKGCSLSYRSNERSCFWLDIEKELKAFEIIKEKKFDTYHFIKTNYQNYSEYLDRMCLFNGCDRDNLFEKCWGILTQEEFDLLKEVLKDE